MSYEAEYFAGRNKASDKWFRDGVYKGHCTGIYFDKELFLISYTRVGRLVES